MILNWLQPKFAAEMIISEKLCLEIESHFETCIDWTSFNFQLKDFSAV